MILGYAYSSMNRNSALASLFALSLVMTAPSPLFAESEPALKGPIPAQASTSVPVNPVPPKQTDTDGMAGFAAPGAGAMMTPDMLLVTPSNPTQQAVKPLKDLIGSHLKIQIDRSDIVFDKFHGVMITVSNETNRPVVVDGDKGTANAGGEEFTAVPVSAIQQAIIPLHKTSQDFEQLLTKAVPAGATVGVAPTLRDIRQSRKPVLQRYGPDELRRKIEYSRFGRRILWTGQKVQGILYFQSDADLTGAKITIPATTLFDAQDTSMLTSAP